MSLGMDQWKALVAGLRERCPLSKKRLVVRRSPIRASLDGVTHLSENEKTVTIVVNSSKPWATQVAALIHEWGHALWFDDADWHDDKWGKHHARVYRVWSEMQ